MQAALHLTAFSATTIPVVKLDIYIFCLFTGLHYKQTPKYVMYETPIPVFYGVVRMVLID